MKFAGDLTFQVVFVYQCHESLLNFELPANIETMAMIDSIIGYGRELLHLTGEIYSFKVDIWEKQYQEVILLL